VKIAENTVTTELIRELGLFEGLDDQRLQALASLFTAVDIASGAEFIRDGESADYLYVLLEGRVAISVSIPGRAAYETVVSTLSKGQLVGWSALLPETDWQATVSALKPCRLIRARAESIRQLCEQDPVIGYCLMKNALVVVGQRLSESRLQLLDIFGGRDG
jgi:CRP-like cAMP-binding protein